MNVKTRYNQKTPKMMLKVKAVVVDTHDGKSFRVDIEDGFLIHEDSDVFPIQIKVQDGTITKLC